MRNTGRRICGPFNEERSTWLGRKLVSAISGSKLRSQSAQKAHRACLGVQLKVIGHMSDIAGVLFKAPNVAQSGPGERRS